MVRIYNAENVVEAPDTIAKQFVSQSKAMKSCPKLVRN